MAVEHWHPDDPLRRCPGETDKQHAAFVNYALLGLDRSVEKLSRILGKSPRNLRGWSSANAWVARAEAYDAQYLERLRIAEEDERMASRRKRRAEYDKALDKAVIAVDRADLEGLPLTAAVAALDKAAAGLRAEWDDLPTQPVRLEDYLGQLTDQQIAAIVAAFSEPE